MTYSRNNYEIDSLQLDGAVDIKEKVIRSTTENPAIYTQKLPLDNLVAFLREDWRKRNISSHFESEQPMVRIDEALRLIGAENNADGEVVFDISQWQHSEDYDLFRKCFFGVWEDLDSYFSQHFILDDSEQSYLANQHIYHFGDFYMVSDSVAAFTIYGNTEGRLFWIDISIPNADIMYYTAFNGNVLFDDDVSGDTNGHTCYYIKLGEANSPQNGYLSVYRLREISRSLGMEISMLTDIEYQPVGSAEKLYHNDSDHLYPVYLVEESPDRLVLKTSVGNIMTRAEAVSVTYTVERINGVWQRTSMEFSAEGSDG